MAFVIAELKDYPTPKESIYYPIFIGMTTWKQIQLN